MTKKLILIASLAFAVNFGSAHAITEGGCTEVTFPIKIKR